MRFQLVADLEQQPPKIFAQLKTTECGVLNLVHEGLIKVPFDFAQQVHPTLVWD